MVFQALVRPPIENVMSDKGVKQNTSTLQLVKTVLCAK